MPQPHMGAPQGARYPHWTILLAPATLGQVTKTGKSDDSVFCGGSQTQQLGSEGA